MVVDEPYLGPGAETRDFAPITVPAGEVFFMGDKRGNSVGSSLVGPVAASAVRGHLRWVGAPSMGVVVGLTLGLAVLWVLQLRDGIRGRVTD